MFGGSGSTGFTGSAGGGDTLVGGSGDNSFSMTGGDIAFGGPGGSDTFDTGVATVLIVEGSGTTQVRLGGGHATAFAGSGMDTYTVARGVGGDVGIIGFKVGDHIALTGGFTSADASAALSTASIGSFGTILNLSDGTRMTLFGTTLTTSQISNA